MVDSSPTQGRRCICDLITMADETDPLPGKIVEGIRTNSGLQEIAIAEFPEEEGRIHYWGNLYIPKDNELRLRIIQEHHDTAIAGHLGRAKTFVLLDWR